MKLDVVFPPYSQTLIYTPVSQMHYERVREISNLLYCFPPTCDFLLIHLYPVEVKIFMKKFPNLHFDIVDEEKGSPTIYIGISKMQN